MKSICNRIDRDRISQFEDGGGGRIRTIQQRQNNKVPVGIPRHIKKPNLQIVCKKKEEEEIGFGEKRKNFILKA